MSNIKNLTLQQSLNIFKNAQLGEQHLNLLNSIIELGNSINNPYNITLEDISFNDGHWNISYCGDTVFIECVSRKSICYGDGSPERKKLNIIYHAIQRNTNIKKLDMKVGSSPSLLTQILCFFEYHFFINLVYLRIIGNDDDFKYGLYNPMSRIALSNIKFLIYSNMNMGNPKHIHDFSTIFRINHSLVYVDISSNRLGNHYIEILMKSLMANISSKIAILKLNNNRFGDEGLLHVIKALKFYKEIIDVDIDDCCSPTLFSTKVLNSFYEHLNNNIKHMSLLSFALLFI